MKQLEISIKLKINETYMRQHNLSPDDIRKCVTITPREAFVAVAATTFLPGTNQLADELFDAGETSLSCGLLSNTF